MGDDRIEYMTSAELKALEKTLAQLDDQDLGEWDRDFVDDMCRRIFEYESRTIVTGRQWQQIERMKEQYL